MMVAVLGHRILRWCDEDAVADVKAVTETKRAVDAAEKKARHKKFGPPPESTRASKRTRGEKPQYNREKIDNFGDEMDAKIEKQQRTSASAEEKAAARAEAMEAARRMLEEARERLRNERASTSSTKILSTKKGGADGWVGTSSKAYVCLPRPSAAMFSALLKEPRA